MAEVKLTLTPQHIPTGSKWREFADRAGVDALLILSDIFGGSKENIPKKEFFFKMAMQEIPPKIAGLDKTTSEQDTPTSP
jgi:hypothetical protein